MFYLKFNDSEEIIQMLDNEIDVFEGSKIVLKRNNFINETGFIIYDENKKILKDFSAYKTVYETGEDYVIYTDDDLPHYVFFLYDEDGFVRSFSISREENSKFVNSILIRFGTDSSCCNVNISEFLDENDNPKYRVINGELFELSDHDRNLWFEKLLENTKRDKLIGLSARCKEMIENGIIYDGKRFSYDRDDQANILNLYNQSRLNNCSVFYHANGEEFECFSNEKIAGLYSEQELNKRKHLIYFNQLREYINSLDDIQEIEKTDYGMKLSGIFLEKYNDTIRAVEDSLK